MQYIFDERCASHRRKCNGYDERMTGYVIWDDDQSRSLRASREE
jgi:hypothetical protein